MNKNLGLLTIVVFFLVGCKPAAPTLEGNKQEQHVELPATWTAEAAQTPASSDTEMDSITPTGAPSSTQENISPTPNESSNTFPTRIPLEYEEIPTLSNGEMIQITQIFMSTSQAGWAIGYQDTHQQYILHTQDGGLSWQDRSPLIRVPIRDYPRSDQIFFHRYDENNAWVLFAETEASVSQGHHIVWQTVDAGLSWTPSKPLSFPQVQPYISPGWLLFIDQNTGWLLAKTEIFQMHDWAFLFSTSDGGMTWDLVNQLGDSMIENRYNTGIQFANELDGWVTKDELGGGIGPFLEQSHDGGYTWDLLILPHPEGREWNESFQSCQTLRPEFTSSNTGYVLVQCFPYNEETNQFLMENPEVYVYATSDWGENWEIEVIPSRVDQLFFIDTQIGFAMGTDHYKTVNGGADWIKYKTVAWDGKFNYINSNEGWVVAKRGDQFALLHTSNSGQTYQEIKPIVSQ